MRVFWHPILLVIMLLVVGSCDNDIDVNAPWEENTIAYGLLDRTDTIHYIKINKAYLNENRNAREIAANNPDSIYHDQKIDPKLQVLSNGVVQQTYELVKDTLQNKEPGLFSYPDHIMYRNKTPFIPNPDFEYRLKIDSLNQEEAVTAKTSVVGIPALISPIIPPPPKEQVAKPSLGVTEEVSFLWQVPDNARFLAMDLNTVYYETNTETGVSRHDTIDWVVFRFLRTSGRQERYQFKSADYFRLLQNEIEADPNFIRPVDSVKLEIVISAGADALYQYYRVNRPSISIVQKSPDYTNINNGQGLFSSKTTFTYPGRLSEETKDSFVNGRFTKNLNFKP